MVFGPDGKRVKHLPNEQKFKQQRSRLPQGVYDALVADARRLCDECDDANCYDLLPRDWTQAHWPTVVSACGNDQDQAVQFVAHVLWAVLEQCSDNWTFASPDVQRFDPASVRFYR